MLKRNKIPEEENIALTLRQMAMSSSDGCGKIITDAQKAAAKGKTFLKVKVSKGDHDCVDENKWGFFVGKNPVYTALIEELLSKGFILDCDKDYSAGFFNSGWSYYLIINW